MDLRRIWGLVASLALSLPSLAQEPADRSWVEVVEATRPAVVVIQTDTGEASGFLVDDNGSLVTNHHVIQDATEALVKLASGETFRRVHVLASDPSKDLAILRIESAGLPFLPLGDSNHVSAGQEVILVGAPKGMEQTVSNGIVSGTRLTKTGVKVIQTTAAASPGSSGGPLLNRRGEVIGVLSFSIAEGQNLNFAIPVNYVRGILGSIEAALTNAPRLLESTEGTDFFQGDRRSGVLLAGYGGPPESFSLVFLELMNFLAANGVSIANQPTSFSPIAGDSASLNYYLDRLNDIGAENLLYLRVNDRMGGASTLELQCFDSAGNLLWQERSQKTFTWVSSTAAKSLVKKIKKKLKPRIGKPGLPLRTR